MACNKEACAGLTQALSDHFTFHTCFTRTVSVDPQRNFDAHWATAGTTLMLGTRSYPGSKPNVIPEMVKIQAYTRSLSESSELLIVAHFGLESTWFSCSRAWHSLGS